MADFQMWNLVIDTLLVLSVLHLCYRFVTSSSSRVGTKLLALESSLKVLIDEAERSGELLNEKLLKRKGELDRLLIDLDHAEHKATKSLEDCQDVSTNIRALLSRSEKQQESLKINTTRRRSAEQTEAPAVETRREEPASPVRSAQETARPRFDFQAKQAPAAAPLQSQPNSAHSGALNIYGEPIGAPAAPVMKQSQSVAEEPVAEKPVQKNKAYTPLSEQVQKERQNPYQSSSVNEQDEIQKIYDAAEKLLKAGSSIQNVSQTTSLPMEEVRMLAQMIGQEDVAQSEGSVSRDDPALGVLGSINRKTQVL